jgi:DNA processing protein
MSRAIPQEFIERFFRERAAVPLDALAAECERHSITILGKDQDDYPPLLKETANAPIALFRRGSPDVHALTLAIVGTRRPTSYGIRVTRELAGEYARAGICIISGLAFGIDSVAHQAALDAGGRTLAVLGCGLDRIYPPRNTGLAEHILRCGGALLSEYPPGTPALRHHFPLRNRIIAGCASGVVVTEAPERSGALITASLALDENRDVFAVPGPITSPASQGTNRLLRDGAYLLEDAQSVLQAFHVPTTLPRQRNEPLTNDERALLSCIGHDPLTVDQICSRCTLETSVINATLICLQLKGWVVQCDPLRYARNR